MDNVLLTACVHGHNGQGKRGLLAQESEQLFRETIAPTLTEHSLVLVEGEYFNTLLRPGHKYYEPLRAELGTALQNVRPTLGAVDPRIRKNSDNAKARTVEWMCRAMSAYEFTITSVPRTFEELLEIAAQPDIIRLLRRPDRETLELARWLLTQSRRFDREFLSALKKYGSRFDQCVILAGSSHSISLALQTGRPIRFLYADTEERRCEVLKAYFDMYKFPMYLLEGFPAS